MVGFFLVCVYPYFEKYTKKVFSFPKNFGTRFATFFEFRRSLRSKWAIHQPCTTISNDFIDLWSSTIFGRIPENRIFDDVGKLCRSKITILWILSGRFFPCICISLFRKPLNRFQKKVYRLKLISRYLQRNR